MPDTPTAESPLHEYMRFLAECFPREQVQRAALIHYNRLADMVEVYWSDVRCYAEQHTPYLTVMRSCGRGVPIGVKVYGIRDLLAGQSMLSREPGRAELAAAFAAWKAGELRKEQIRNA